MSHRLLMLMGSRQTVFFDPTTVSSSCVCFLKPDDSTMLTDLSDPVSEGSRVGYWFDQTGNANDGVWFSTNTAPTYRAGIQNNLPMLLFDGVNDRLDTHTLAQYFDGDDAQATVAIVFKRTGATADAFFSVGNSASANGFLYLHTDNFGWFVTKNDDAGLNVARGGGTPNQSAHLMIVRLNGTTTDMWIDSTQIVTGGAQNLGVLTLNSSILGARIRSTVDNFHAGYIGTLIVYPEALSNPNISALQTGLLLQWGL